MTDHPIIKGLRARAVNVPLEFPIRTGSGTVATAPLVLIDVMSNDGSIGHAYVFTYTPLALTAVRDLLLASAELIVGKPLAPHVINAEFEQRLRLIGHTGLLRLVSAGIDMAIWDGLARSQKLPLYALLGGVARPLPAYDSHSMDGEMVGVERAVRSCKEGFQAVKTKIGYATLDEDIRIVRALREAMGPNVELMVDYNQSLSVPESIRRGREIALEGVSWLEEPTHQQDYVGHARIRSEVRLPIQMGENWHGVDEMQKAIDARALDFAMPDVMKIGGVTGWMKAAALAETHRIPMSSHIFQEISAHLLCVTPTAHWLEKMGIADAVLLNPLRFSDGKATMSDSPGTGVEWNEAAIEVFLI